MINWELTAGRTAVVVKSWEEAQALIEAAIEDKPEVNRVWGNGDYDKAWYEARTKNGEMMAFRTEWDDRHSNMTYTTLRYFKENGYRLVYFSDIVIIDDLPEIKTPVLYLFE